MKLFDYYKSIYDDNKISNEDITYLSYIHLYNSIIKRDGLSNEPIFDNGNNYISRYLQNIKEYKHPLCAIHDDIDSIWIYTFPHFKEILTNPHMKILKEQELVRLDKVKSIDKKSLSWLMPKSGVTIREKVGSCSKIMTTTKRFTFDMKENQVMVNYFLLIKKVLFNKLKMVASNEELFGNQNDDCKKIKSQITKINNIIKQDFSEVKNKSYSIPNNALIGNIHYKSFWNSSVKLRTSTIDVTNSLIKYCKMVFNLFILNLMSTSSFIEKNALVSEIVNYKIIQENSDGMIEYTFEDDFKINKKIFKKVASSLNLTTSIEYKFIITSCDNESTNGLKFTLMCNEAKQEFFANLESLNSIIDFVKKIIGYNASKEYVIEEAKEENYLLSISSFDNNTFGINTRHPLLCFDNKGTYLPTEYLDCGHKVLSLSSFEDIQYPQLLKIVNKASYNLDNYLIYDIKDDFDQFSSQNLRSNVSAIFSNSYPVWRSILGVESYGESKINMVIDTCGKSISLTSIGYKLKKFVHKSPAEKPYLLKSIEDTSVISELAFYNRYIEMYSKKYNINIDSMSDIIIRSGKLNDLFIHKKDIILFDKNIYLYIKFDSQIFDDIVKIFLNNMEEINDFYSESNVLFIIPDFINNISIGNSINNSKLLIGAFKINKYLKNNDIAWYEDLPQLSLEIIKDGMYKSFVIVKNQEVANIIGKTQIIEVKEHMVLPKGCTNIIMPLEKSFVGEDNKNFNAVIEDKSFPLQNDLSIKLRIKYNFQNINSYDLSVIPVDKNAPFKQIDVEWKEEDNNNFKKLYTPQISGLILDEDGIKQAFDCLESDIYNIKVYADSIINSYDLYNHKIHPRNFNGFDIQIKNVYRIFPRFGRTISFNLQKLFYTNKNLYKKYFKAVKDANVIDVLLKHHTYLVKRYLKDQRPNSLYDIEDSEDFLIRIFPNKQFFFDGTLQYPFLCYGIYLSYHIDTDIVKMANNDLYRILLDNKIFGNKALHNYIEKFSWGPYLNPKMYLQIMNIYPLFIVRIADLCVQMLKDLATSNWTTNENTPREQNPREKCYMLRLTCELLIPLLYCRDSYVLSDYLPNRKRSKEIIKYLKICNEKYFAYIKTIDNPDEKDKINMRAKYNIHVDIPEDLNNTIDIIYALILYFKNDERTNLIKVVRDEKN